MKAIIFDCFGVFVIGRLNTRLVDFVKTLKPGYKIALLSNVDSKAYLEQKFLPENIDLIFDTVVASGDEGVAKPDVRIYNIAASRLGVAPEECVMVDDIIDFCEAAEHAGMRSVHFKSTEQCMEDISLLIDRGRPTD